MKKKKSMGILSLPSKKGEFNVTKNLRLQDVIEWPDYRTIDYLIKNHPVDLWNRIYQKKKGVKNIKLVGNAYKLLKSKVEETNSKLIEDVKKKKHNKKVMKDLRNEIKYDILGTRHSKFRKPDSEKSE